MKPDSNNSIKTYHLKYEVKPFQEDTVLFESRINRVLTKYVEQYFRTWSFVTFEELRNVIVFKIQDKDGEFYVADTRSFIPWWLKTNEENLPPAREILPKDKLIKVQLKKKIRPFEFNYFRPSI